MPRYYPISLNIVGKRCVVVGGGAVAERKVLALLEAGGSVHVVSPTLTPLLETLAADGKIAVTNAVFAPEHLTDAFLAIAATDKRDVNAAVLEAARGRGGLINIADAPENSDFVTESAIRRGDFTLSITTGGNSPSLAARLAAELEARFGPEFGEFVELLGLLRDYIKENVPEAFRRRAHARLLDAEETLRPLLKTQGRDAAYACAVALISDTI